MKKFFVEISVGIFMDEMDDDNSPDSVAEIADGLIRESLDLHWTDQIETIIVRAVQLSPYADESITLNAWSQGDLF